MTIFLNVAKVVIHDTINTIIDDSQKANKTYWATTTRAIAISEAKCAQLRKCLKELPGIMDGVNDGATRDLLSGFIIAVLGEVEKARGMEHSEGNTELTLKSLLTSLPLIYHDLEHRPLLDIPDDSTPLNQFRNGVALFYARKMVRNNMPGFKPEQLLGAGLAFSAALDQTVQNALIKCTRSMLLQEKLAAASPDIVKDAADSKCSYPLIQTELVLYHFEALKRAQKELTSGYKFVSYFHPDNELLKRCLSERVDELSLTGIPENTFDEQDEESSGASANEHEKGEKPGVSVPPWHQTRSMGEEGRKQLRGMKELGRDSLQADHHTNLPTQDARLELTTSTGLMLTQLANGSGEISFELPVSKDRTPSSIPVDEDKKPLAAKPSLHSAPPTADSAREAAVTLSKKNRRQKAATASSSTGANFS